MKITRIPRRRDLHKKRVAAYCRVSTLLEEQEESFEVQIDYYTRFIKAHGDWEFAGIYSDEKSGRKTENRPGFQSLIEDALTGKIDKILCKSVSRFSRDIINTLKYVKILHGNGVDIWFEKENLDTVDPSCTMILSFLSTIAQDESHSISENVKWSYRERYKRGEYNLGNNRILGFDSVDGKLVPNDKALAVRSIYNMFLEGKSIEEIRRTLANLGVVTRGGKPLSHHGILYILQNEAYKGDKLLQRQPPKDFFTRKPDWNKPYQHYYLKDDHEPIIEPAVWDAVQEKIKQHTDLMDAVGHLGGRPHFLYGKVFCADCGSPLTRRTFTGASKTKYKAWVCRDRQRGRKGNGCKLRIVKEDALFTEISNRMGWDDVTEERMEEIERVKIGADGMEITKRQ
jgi:DNA invertase Pin-like site-specific DNA recombinase